MKRNKVNSKIEENIITAMITSKEFLGQVAPSIEINFFTANHFRIIAKWCLSYFEKYHKAPEHHIETKYNSFVEKGNAKEETIDAINDILSQLSDNQEQEQNNNIPYLIDEASKFFSLRKFEQLKENLEDALYSKDIDIAENAVQSFRTVVLGSDIGIDTFSDRNAVKTAFNESYKPLFTMGSKAVNGFFESLLCRDTLIGILAPEGRGKTFWCVEFYIRALMSRRKVALFEVGDMSQSQIIKRHAVRLTGLPMFKNQCGKIQIPVKIIKLRSGKIKTQQKTKFVKNPINEKAYFKAVKKFKRRFGLSENTRYCMTSCHANSSINIAEISGILNKWEYENDFVPDVIIIDYPDILAEESCAMGYSARDKINETWKALKRLTQEKHCLVITPTQADAASYDQELITAKNFSEDKRKLGHVNGMFCLNQTRDEQVSGIMRLNWIKKRESAYTVNKCLYVGQCLSLARTYCCGYF